MDFENFKIPQYGMGTDFAQSEQSPDYAPLIRNRFLNITGAAERRSGYTALTTAVTGAPSLTRFHEYVAKSGIITMMTSTDTGTLYRYDGTTWNIARSGMAASRLLSVQDNDVMIFFNGVDRNFYTDDGGITFKDVVARINQGKAGGASGPTTLVDADVTNFTTIGAANNDVVYNATKNAYAVVTNIATATITQSTIGPAGTGLGLAASNQAPGDAYVLIDTLEDNIINLGSGVYDNTATAGVGTNSTTIAVAGTDFTTIGVIGNYVLNTTRNALMKVTAVGTNLTVTSVTGQIAGDALVFLKDAMPITSYAHINWGRVYYMDAKDKNRVRISSKDDPFDLTTFSNTFNASSYSFGALQPQGDNLQSFTTFQRFFVAAGKRYVYVFNGTDPIADAANSTTSFTPVSVYPQGCVSRFALGSTGNDLLFVSPDGLINAAVGSDNNSLVSGNLNEVLKSVIRAQLRVVINPDDIQLVFYPRRNWIILKIDQTMYILNQSSIVSTGGELQKGGTWSYFDGNFASHNHYYVRQNGDLVAVGANGGVWSMDTGFTDNGIAIETAVTFPWTWFEGDKRTTRIKQGKYIKPTFESGGGIIYSIQVSAGFDNTSTDSISVTSVGGGVVSTAIIGTTAIGGTGVQTNKYPLRWRGEQAQISITTSSTQGPDILTGYALYGEVGGFR